MRKERSGRDVKAGRLCRTLINHVAPTSIIFRFVHGTLKRVDHYPKTYLSLVSSLIFLAFSFFFLLISFAAQWPPLRYLHAVIIVTDYCRDGRKACYLGHLDGTGTKLLAIYYWTIRVSILHDERTVYGASNNYTTELFDEKWSIEVAVSLMAMKIVLI